MSTKCIVPDCGGTPNKDVHGCYCDLHHWEYLYKDAMKAWGRERKAMLKELTELRGKKDVD